MYVSAAPVLINGLEVERARLEAAKEQFRLAIEAAPNGMVLTDSEGRMVITAAGAPAKWRHLARLER